MRHKRLAVVALLALLASLAALLLTGGLTGAITQPGASGGPPQGAQAAVIAPGVGGLEEGVPASPLEVPMPELVNFQGRLTDPSTGDPVANGVYSITFRIFNAPTGPTMLWQETQVVEVYGGLFNVVLGSVTPFPDGVFSGGNTFLEVQVAGDPPMTPRLHFNSVPYAFHANTANWAETSHWGGLAGVPAGFADNIDNDVLAGLSCANGQVAKWNSGAGQWQCANDQTGAGGDFWALTGNSATNPSTNFLGTTDNQPLVLRTNGTERMRIDAAGNVGIGTSSPQAKLDVNNGDVRLSTGVNIHDWALGVWGNSMTGEGYLYLKDLDVGLPRLVIDQNTGNVLAPKLGVGAAITASSVSHSLTVQSSDEETVRLIGPDGGGLGYGARLNFGDGDYVYLEEDTDDNLYVRADRTAIMGGNVGIGTTSPQQKLHVAGIGRFDLGGGRVEMSTPGGWPGMIAYAPGGNRRDIIFSDNSIRLLTSSSGGPGGAANGITIDEAGQVGIGTNSPSARLEASGTSGDLLRLTNPSSPTGPVVFRVDSSGQVFADASYNCGLSSTSACLQAGQGADIAERFDASGPVEPGDVIEVDPDHAGLFRKTRSAYSSLVVGIVSSAPAVTLGNGFDAKLDQWEDDRPLLALAGKVPVKVTTENGPIQAGDLLVSSNSAGQAMRCEDPAACAGAIVGKALEPLDEGTGLIYASVLVH